MILHHCKLTAGDTLSWLLEKRHQINYWWILHNYRIIYEYIVCKLFSIHYFDTLPLQYPVHRKSTAQLVQYYFLTDIEDQSTLSAIDSWMLCVLILFLYHLHFFSLSKISLNILLIFRLKKFSAVCSFYWVLPGYLISGDWIKTPFFSLFPARFMLRLHVLNLEVQECSRQHKIVLKICFIIN